NAQRVAQQCGIHHEGVTSDRQTAEAEGTVRCRGSFPESITGPGGDQANGKVGDGGIRSVQELVPVTIEVRLAKHHALRGNAEDMALPGILTGGPQKWDQQQESTAMPIHGVAIRIPMRTLRPDVSRRRGLPKFGLVISGSETTPVAGLLAIVPFRSIR